jgi:membrane fusion protein (multidrug efflux system)
MPDPESNSKSARQRFRFSRAAWIVVALMMLALIVWQGFGFLSFRSTHVTTSDARIEANVISVASRSAGWITHFDLISADPVHKGEVLAFIYRRPAAESLAELRAQRSVLEAQIDASREQLAQTRGRGPGDKGRGRRCRGQSQGTQGQFDLGSERRSAGPRRIEAGQHFEAGLRKAGDGRGGRA